jgi:Ala-tRNA(Pro) deacylase
VDYNSFGMSPMGGSTLMNVIDFLRSRRIWFETLLHAPASAATKLAGSVHVPGRRVGKAVLVNTGGSRVLAVLPATSRVDIERLAAALRMDAGDVSLASSEQIEAIFGDCEPGAIPPFGRRYGLTTVVDSSLAELDVVVFPTNTRHIGLRMRFRDFVGLEEPLHADFARPIAQKTTRRLTGRRLRAG